MFKCNCSKKDNIYIRALEYAENQEEFTFQQLCDEIKPSDLEKIQLHYQVLRKQLFFNKDITDFKNDFNHKSDLFHFSVNDKFMLLRHRELKEARKSSKIAIYIAFGSFIFAIFTFIITFVNQDKDIDYTSKIKPLLEKIQANSESQKHILDLFKQSSFKQNKTLIQLSADMKDISNENTKIIKAINQKASALIKKETQKQ